MTRVSEDDVSAGVDEGSSELAVAWLGRAAPVASPMTRDTRQVGGLLERADALEQFVGPVVLEVNRHEPHPGLIDARCPFGLIVRAGQDADRGAVCSRRDSPAHSLLKVGAGAGMANARLI